MADTVPQAERSRIMSLVHSKHTSPEIAVRKALHAAGFRFRLHVNNLPGKPDIVLPRYRTVVQVHGCLWHGHNCPTFQWPATNVDYWKKKIERNTRRDTVNIQALKDKGWDVKIVWDCDLKESIKRLLDDMLQMKHRSGSSRAP